MASSVFNTGVVKEEGYALLIASRHYSAVSGVCRLFWTWLWIAGH